MPDLVRYLRKKEEFMQQPGVIISATGEEDLLGRYMSTTRDAEHEFPKIPKGANFIALPEGDWQVYRTSPQWQAKQQANEISYLWDALIEHQSKFIRSGKAISVPWLPDSDGSHHERIVRALASQPRLARRSLSTDFHFVMQRSEPGRMFARIKMTGRPPDRAFVFLTMPRTEGEDYNTTYRHRRMHALTVYCHAVKSQMPMLKEAIGIASEPFSEGSASQDFMHVDLSTISAEELMGWRKEADELDILRPKTEMQLSRHTEREFPVPFRFVDSPSKYVGKDGVPMNRAARRAADKQQRRERKN